MTKAAKIGVSDVTMRPAEISDAELLSNWALRQDASIATGCADFDWHRELAKNTSWREIWIAEHNGRAVGVSVVVAAIREGNNNCHNLPTGSRSLAIWIGNPNDCGHGIGSAFILLLFGRVFDDPGVPCLLVNPPALNRSAIQFYRRLGFRSIASRSSDNDSRKMLKIDRYGGLFAQLSALEPVFHHLPPHRIDRPTLEALVDFAFWEIGASGQVYSRDYVIETVLQRGPDAPSRRMVCSDFSLMQVSPNVYHFGYLLDDSGRRSRRTSLWKRDTGTWRILFHQGTLVS